MTNVLQTFSRYFAFCIFFLSFVSTSDFTTASDEYKHLADGAWEAET